MPARVSSTTATGRAGSPAALAAAGILFALYPALRPWADTSPGGAADAFADPAWVPAHLMAVAGFVLLPLGLLGLRTALAGGPGSRPAGAALLTTWVGVGLTLPYYGAEAFALHALGQQVQRTGGNGSVALADAVRMGPAQLTTFGVGLLLVAAGGVLAAVAVWRSGAMPRGAGVPLAVALALYLPQFFAAPGVRIAHGVLVAAGCLVLAAALRASYRH